MFQDNKQHLLAMVDNLHIPQESDKFSKVLQQELLGILNKYSETIVYEDCLALAKQDIGEIKSIRKTLKEKTKLILEELEKPIRDFKELVKSLDSMCEDVEKKITQRVDFFKEQDREVLKGLISVEVQKELRRNFLDSSLEEKISVEDLLRTLSKSLTKGGALSKYAKDEIEKRVEALLETIKTQQKVNHQTQPQPIQETNKMPQQMQSESTQAKATMVQTPQGNQSQRMSQVESVQIIDVKQEVESSKTIPNTNGKNKTTRKLLVCFKLDVEESITNDMLEKMLREKLESKGFKSVFSVNSL